MLFFVLRKVTSIFLSEEKKYNLQPLDAAAKQNVKSILLFSRYSHDCIYIAGARMAAYFIHTTIQK